MSKKLSKKDKEILKEQTSHVEKALQLLYDSCELQAKNFNSQVIPLLYMKQAMAVIIKGYKEGLPKE